MLADLELGKTGQKIVVERMLVGLLPRDFRVEHDWTTVDGRRAALLSLTSMDASLA
jgi:hypothetical protein